MTGIDREEIEDSTNQQFSRKDNNVGAAALTDDETEPKKSNNTQPATIDVDADEKVCCQQCVVWREKYHQLKKSHAKLSLRHTNQLMKHDDLLEVATGSSNFVSAEAPSISETLPESATSASANSLAQISGEASKTLSKVLKHIHVKVSSPAPTSEQVPSSNVFTPNEINRLRSLPLEKKNDSNFILHCIEYAYKNRTAVLPNKTMNGTRDRYEVKDGTPTIVRQGKDPLTPEKVHEIKKLFIKRISDSRCLAGEFGDRIKPTYVNQLIATAIKNVSNKEKPIITKANRNKDLNL